MGPKDLPVTSSPVSSEITGTCLGPEDLNSGPHDCVASTLLTVQSSQPPESIISEWLWPLPLPQKDPGGMPVSLVLWNNFHPLQTSGFFFFLKWKYEVVWGNSSLVSLLGGWVICWAPMDSCRIEHSPQRSSFWGTDTLNKWTEKSRRGWSLQEGFIPMVREVTGPRGKLLLLFC